MVLKTSTSYRFHWNHGTTGKTITVITIDPSGNETAEGNASEVATEAGLYYDDLTFDEEGIWHIKMACAVDGTDFDWTVFVDDTIYDILEDTGTTLPSTLSGLAPASEYNTEMGYITEAVATEAKQDIIDGIVDTLVSRVTAVVATEAKQDVIDGLVDTLISRVTAVVATEAKQDIIDGIVDAIKVKTDNLPTDPADASDIATAHGLLATEAKQDVIDGLVDTLITRVTAAVATEAKQDVIDGLVDTLISRVTAAVATEAKQDVIDGIVDAIKAKTDNLPTDPADASDIATAHGLLATEAKQDIIDGIVDTLVSRVTAAVATEAKQDIIDGIVDDLATDVEEAHERSFRRTYGYDAESESVSSASEADLTSPGANTITFPTGATLLEGKVVAYLKVNNQSAAEHNIGVTLQKNVAGGGWEDVKDFTTNPHLTLAAVDGDKDSLTLVEIVTVTTGQSVDFRFQVDSDNAGEVHYLSDFVYVAEYDFQ